MQRMRKNRWIFPHLESFALPCPRPILYPYEKRGDWPSTCLLSAGSQISLTATIENNELLSYHIHSFSNLHSHFFNHPYSHNDQLCYTATVLVSIRCDLPIDGGSVTHIKKVRPICTNGIWEQCCICIIPVPGTRNKGLFQQTQWYRRYSWEQRIPTRPEPNQGRNYRGFLWQIYWLHQGIPKSKNLKSLHAKAKYVTMSTIIKLSFNHSRTSLAHELPNK